MFEAREYSFHNITGSIPYSHSYLHSLVAMSSSIKSYFERKRRDLSYKSTNKEERKKARKSSLGLSLNKETSDDTDVFTKGIESLRCDITLYDCLKNLESKINEIYDLFSSTKDTHIKGAKQLEDVSESIKFINENFEEYEADWKQKEKEISELKENLAPLKESWQNARSSGTVFKKELSSCTWSGWKE